MKTYNKIDISKSLKKIGIKKGDHLFINPEIFKLGFYEMKEDNKEAYYGDFISSLKNAVGSRGTLCINSYTFDTLRSNKKFVFESNNTTSGMLSSYFLKQKGVVRSKHPVFSVAAIGHYAKYICSKNSFHNYGYNSPYQKFIKINGKILNIGMEPWRNPFNHVAEYMIGVPYCFNKPTKVKYYINNNEKKILYSSFVRFLNINLSPYYKKIQKEISKKKIVKKIKLGSGYIYSFSSRKYTDLCLNILKNNQLAFIDGELYKKSLIND